MVICRRGQLMQRATGLGRMAALEMTEAEAEQLSGPYFHRISIAAANSPTSIVVSGELDAIDEIVSAAKARGARAKILPVDYAFHSAQMEPYRTEMAKAVSGLSVQAASVPIYSTVTGAQATNGEFGAEYWGRNIRQTVRFATAIRSMLEAGFETFVELSPHPVLSSMVLECAEAASRQVEILPSLRRGHPERIQMFRSLAGLFAAGTDIDWTGVYPEGGRVTSLPNYPWQRKRFWFDKSSAELRPAALIGSAAVGMRLPCHGRRLHSPVIHGFVFEARWRASGFLRDHRVFDTVIVPAPLLIEMALSAASEVFSEPSAAVRDLMLHRPLILAEERERVVHVVFDSPSDSCAEFKIHSADIIVGCEPDWTLHATGRIPLRSEKKVPGSAISERFDESALRDRLSETLSAGDFYGFFEKRGVRLGPAFRVVEHLELGEGEAVAKFSLPSQLAGELPDYRVHPVLLDAALQTIAVCHSQRDQTTESGDALWLFCGLEQLRVTSAGASKITCHAVSESVEDVSAGMFRGRAQLYDENGFLIAEIQGARFRQATRESLMASDEVNPADLLFEVAWRPRCCPSHALQRKAVDYLPALQLIQERLLVELAGQSCEDDDDSAAEVISGFHQLAAQYVTRAFQELRWNPAVGDRFGAQEVMARLQILDQHARLFTRMLEILDEEGLVKRLNEGWEVVKPWPPGVAEPAIRDLGNRFPDYHAELDLFDRCSSRLSEVLAGACNPLELLFPQGSLKSTGSVYQDSPMSRAPNGMIREVLRVATETLPQGRILRVLEIGAGTGGTTAHLLPLLKDVPCEYVFSDVSRLFLESAREKFSEFPFLRFALLDVECSPEVQGFASQQFDLIIAANVLHATRDLRQTLAHVQSLLVPGGLLALLEGYRETRWIDLVFGQTEGWWRFADTDLRPSHPLLSLETWKRVLDEAGFSSVSAVPAKAKKRPSIFEQAVIMAKAAVAPTQGAEIASIADSRLASGVKQEQGAWLIFGDESPECHALTRLLTMRGNEVVRIARGGDFETLDERSYRVDVARPDQIRQAVDAALAAFALPCRHAICLWGLTSPEKYQEFGALYDHITALCSQALGAAQSLISNAATKRPRLWLVTRGAQLPSTAGLPMLAGAPLWGLGRVIAVEHPEIWGGMLDLDPTASPSESAEAILAQAATPDGEDQCAFRAAVRFVPRLVPQAPADIVRNPFVCAADGCYLITGGLGGMGLHIAQWLARQGARKLVLLGRTPLAPRSEWEMVERGSRAFEQIASIREIEGIGAAVKTVAIDIANQRDVERLLKSLDTEEWLPIYGVVHTAAVTDDRLVPNLDIQGLKAAFRPKILGTLTLEHCLVDQPLQFFVCCSSVGALLGQTGQANYAAANAFLDAFVQQRRIKEQPALGINWGGWYGAGLAMTTGGQRTITSLELRGILGFQPSQGVAALELLMRHDWQQATVIRVDWSRFRKAYPIGEEPALLASLATGIQAPPTAETERPASEMAEAGLRERLFALDSATARQAMLEAQLQSLLATVLKLEVAAIDVEKPMGTLGLDSLMGFEFKNLCEQTFGLTLSATMVWNYPTISALVGHLADKLGITLTDAITPEAEIDFVNPVKEERLTSVMTSVEELSEDEALEALLRGGRY
jgi:malonyl CoA-acyl carrier protein transacylase/NAD(P)-dependent dehydrogenase (short-subunit alcohol dehydrogenase family)/acyl carrier protein